LRFKHKVKRRKGGITDTIGRRGLARGA